MSKYKTKAPSIYTISSYLKEGSFLPIYFFFGEDQFTIDVAIKSVEKALESKVLSEFDRETINPDKSQKIMELLDLVSAFPFGGGSKLITVKNFEKFGDRKNFTQYVNNPVEFAHLVIAYSGAITDLSKEPFASLLKHNYLFEARTLKGAELVQWVAKTGKKHNLIINSEIAQMLVDVIGNEKGLIEMQLNKLSDFLGEGGIVDESHIKELIAVTKEYSIFDLQDALGAGNKKQSLNVALNLLNGGQEVIVILGLLTKYISTLAKSLELTRGNVHISTAAKEAGVSEYYYKNCLKARSLLSERRLLRASQALFKADLLLKTSASDSKTIMIMLISDILG